MAQDVYANFQTPISLEASDQLAQLNMLLLNFMPDATHEDQWTYIWGDTIFKSKRSYKALRGTSPPSPVFKWMWNSCCRGRHEFFLWLLLRDWLNTRNILRRKRGTLDDYSCPLCTTTNEETIFHLFFQCSFSQWCWRLLHIRWNLGLPAMEMLIRARRDFNSNIFTEIIIVGPGLFGNTWMRLFSMVFLYLLGDGSIFSRMSLVW